ncbi:hypothetical protein OUZ56_009906 [Daphnia magna]|uniref:Uncharacterized protein n=1 Tax=Daphnia magna TaxID=35525 RepID=A0ABR0AH91_9CRUS|nr:hypothetical protein OUZ56_009906 [Daphnia magna]
MNPAAPSQYANDLECAGLISRNNLKSINGSRGRYDRNENMAERKVNSTNNQIKTKGDRTSVVNLDVMVAAEMAVSVPIEEARIY